MIYELAQNRKEAEALLKAGFGFDTKIQAQGARATPGIDPYYRNLLKIYAFEDSSANSSTELPPESPANPKSPSSAPKQ